MGRVFFKIIFGGYLSIVSLIGIGKLWFIEENLVIQGKIAGTITFMIFLTWGVKILKNNIKRFRARDFEKHRKEKSVKPVETFYRKSEKVKPAVKNTKKQTNHGQGPKVDNVIFTIFAAVIYFVFGLVASITSQYMKKRR